MLDRGNPSNHMRYRKLTLFAYGFPTFYVILTAFAESTLSSCHPMKPRIGDLGQCFFTGKYISLDIPYFMLYNYDNAFL